MTYEAHTQYYTGIGSRSTPVDVQAQMYDIGLQLARLDYILRSGGADGADAIFERAHTDINGRKEIYLPWSGFNGRPKDNPEYIQKPASEAFKMAAKFHPAWGRCSRGARCLHARNCHQVLGKDLKTRSNFIVCWHQNKGGTMQAIRIATEYEIDIYNLAEKGTLEKLVALLKSLGSEESK